MATNYEELQDKIHYDTLITYGLAVARESSPWWGFRLTGNESTTRKLFQDIILMLLLKSYYLGIIPDDWNTRGIDLLEQNIWQNFSIGETFNWNTVEEVEEIDDVYVPPTEEDRYKLFQIDKSLFTKHLYDIRTMVELICLGYNRTLAWIFRKTPYDRLTWLNPDFSEDQTWVESDGGAEGGNVEANMALLNNTYLYAEQIQEVRDCIDYMDQQFVFLGYKEGGEVDVDGKLAYFKRDLTKSTLELDYYIDPETEEEEYKVYDLEFTNADELHSGVTPHCSLLNNLFGFPINQLVYTESISPFAALKYFGYGGYIANIDKYGILMFNKKSMLTDGTKTAPVARALNTPDAVIPDVGATPPPTYNFTVPTPRSFAWDQFNRCFWGLYLDTERVKYRDPVFGIKVRDTGDFYSRLIKWNTSGAVTGTYLIEGVKDVNDNPIANDKIIPMGITVVAPNPDLLREEVSLGVIIGAVNEFDNLVPHVLLLSTEGEILEGCDKEITAIEQVGTNTINYPYQIIYDYQSGCLVTRFLLDRELNFWQLLEVGLTSSIILLGSKPIPFSSDEQPHEIDWTQENIMGN